MSVNVWGILLVVFCISCLVINTYVTPFIELFQKSFVVKTRSFNRVANLSFKKKPFLQTIVIGNNCFGSAQTLKIDGLNQL